MKRFALIALLFAPLSVFAATPQNAAVSFGLGATDATHNAADGVRLDRDGTAIGTACAAPLTGLCVTDGQSIVNGFPDNRGTFVFTFTAFNTGGSATAVKYQAVLGPPAVLPPNPVINVTIDAPCAKTTPATCSITVKQLP